MALKVTIITAVYNGEKHIRQAIGSVLGQTYPAIEYLVIDGNSTDGTQEILRSYGDRLTWCSEPDAGMYHAMNKGIALAGGELIGILNSDDWYEPDAVAQVVAEYLSSPGGNVFHGKLNRCDPAGNVLFISASPNAGAVLDERMIEHPACFVTRDTYRSSGAFDTAYRSAADYELMLRYRKEKLTFVFVDRILANFRAGGISDRFSGTAETLRLKRHYGVLGQVKSRVLYLYFWFKHLLA